MSLAISPIARGLAFVRSQPMLYRLLGTVRLALFRAELAYAEWAHHRDPAVDRGLPLPGPSLRFRVGGSFDAERFLRIGAACAASIRAAVEAADGDLAACRSVLDFSCGCGRVMRHLAPGLAPGLDLHGADIDPVAITWCRQNLADLATFARTEIEPPLPYRDGQFDLIYVVSLFTHVDERLQDLWLAELSRILAPGGLLVATVHGRHSQRDLPRPDRERIDQYGFVYQVGQTGRLKLDGLPDFYQAAYHSQDYIWRHWRAHLEPLLFRERGMNDDQDVVVLRKPG